MSVKLESRDGENCSQRSGKDGDMSSKKVRSFFFWVVVKKKKKKGIGFTILIKDTDTKRVLSL